MIPARIVLAILAFFGGINLYAMRVNLSVAMVAMVGQPKPSNNSNDSLLTCPELIVKKNSSDDDDTIITGEFVWDSSLQGLVVGSFFYGYLVTQIPGGLVAEKYGSKWVFGCGIFICSLLTLLTPVAARFSVYALIAVRIGEGLACGVVYPSMNALIGKWVPKMERSRIATFMNMGALTGALITEGVAGILTESSFLGGWPSIFYVCGTLGCVWFIFWAVLIYESPEDHPRISAEELDYIQKSKDQEVTKKSKVPWKSIATSLPMWALSITHFGQNWAFYTMMTMMPTYLSNVLHFDLKHGGFVSGLPFLMMVLFAVPASFIADVLRSSGRLQITTIRKIFNSIAFFGPGIGLLVIAFMGCRPTLIIVIFQLSFALNGLIYSGYMVNHVDMSPQYAGTLMGITNAIATIPGFLAPQFVGWILRTGQTLRNWGFVFITSAAMHCLTGLFYDLFGSAELQPWSKNQEEENKEKIPPSPNPSLIKTHM